MSRRNSHAYVGFWPTCACVAAVCVDMRDHSKDTSKHVGDYIRRGFRVERLPLPLAFDWRCPEHPKGTPEPWELAKVGGVG